MADLQERLTQCRKDKEAIEKQERMLLEEMKEKTYGFGQWFKITDKDCIVQELYQFCQIKAYEYQLIGLYGNRLTTFPLTGSNSFTLSVIKNHFELKDAIPVEVTIEQQEKEILEQIVVWKHGDTAIELHGKKRLFVRIAGELRIFEESMELCRDPEDTRGWARKYGYKKTGNVFE